MSYDDNGNLGTNSFKKNIIIQYYYNTINYIFYANVTLCINHTKKKKKALILHNKVWASITPLKKRIILSTSLKLRGGIWNNVTFKQATCNQTAPYQNMLQHSQMNIEYFKIYNLT